MPELWQPQTGGFAPYLLFYTDQGQLWLEDETPGNSVWADLEPLGNINEEMIKYNQKIFSSMKQFTKEAQVIRLDEMKHT